MSCAYCDEPSCDVETLLPLIKQCIDTHCSCDCHTWEDEVMADDHFKYASALARIQVESWTDNRRHFVATFHDGSTLAIKAHYLAEAWGYARHDAHLTDRHVLSVEEQHEQGSGD